MSTIVILLRAVSLLAFAEPIQRYEVYRQPTRMIIPQLF
jgi:hypothetical protein